jgi:hypothetical protein
VPVLIAAIGGAISMAVALALSATNDASDSSLFHLLAIPAGIALCAALGWFFPTRVWRYGLAYGLAMAAVQFIDAGQFGNLWPLVIAFNVIVSLPMMLGAWIARKLAGH